MSWQRPQKTVKYVMAPYTEGGRYKNVPILSSHTNSFGPAPLETPSIISIRVPLPSLLIRRWDFSLGRNFFACKALAK